MALDDEGMLVLLLDYACVDQVAHEDGRGPVVLRLLLRLSHLKLELIESCELGPCLILLVEFGLLFILDLLFGPSSLRAGLEHMDAGAVED